MENFPKFRNIFNAKPLCNKIEYQSSSQFPNQCNTQIQITTKIGRKARSIQMKIRLKYTWQKRDKIGILEFMLGCKGSSKISWILSLTSGNFWWIIYGLNLQFFCSDFHNKAAQMYYQKNITNDSFLSTLIIHSLGHRSTNEHYNKSQFVTRNPVLKFSWNKKWWVALKRDFCGIMGCPFSYHQSP